EILKNASTTGPRASSSLKENCLPSIAASVKSGATVAAVNAAMFFPPKRLRNHLIEMHSSLDDLNCPQDFARQTSKGQGTQLRLTHPASSRGFRGLFSYYPDQVVSYCN